LFGRLSKPDTLGTLDWLLDELAELEEMVELVEFCELIDDEVLTEEELGREELVLTLVWLEEFGEPTELALL
tara:strand:- start:2652 stop:2867 length:216 start_codon:yes stop_codon:yes gene_type:complete